MALNKRQRMSMGVLAIGLVALVVDRMFVLPHSAPAGQAVMTDDYTVTATSDRAVVPPPVSTPPDLTVAAKLEAVWSDNDLRLNGPRDPFSLPPSWPRKRGSEKPPRPTMTAGMIFATNHKLEAITVDPQGRRALIDDKLLRLGETLEGFKLVAIDGESVTFERGGQQIQLELVKDQ
ncbi:MAG: hypothetical protein JSW27_14645 [Phycisphaerales bacterium]|nr:MAG: hypothetical protein JSW27_14645 [Phycisphaerales bacterium]